MTTQKRNFTTSEIESVWKKARIQVNNNPEVFRKDYAGAWIKKNEYGKKTDYGWEIDHLKPLEKGGTNDLDNLVPLHWRNNNSKSDDYPEWKTTVSSDGVSNSEKVQTWYIPSKVNNNE